MHTRATYSLPDGRTIAIVHGDITEANVDAIVNAANEHLQHGGGVAGSHQPPRRRLDPGRKQPVGTRAGQGADRAVPPSQGPAACPPRYVIHAVGPIWGSGDEERKLAAAVTSALTLADEHGVTSIAIPAISSGIYGMPKDVSARVLIHTATEYLRHNPQSTLRTVQFCNIDEVTVKAFEAQAPFVLGEESQ